MKKATDFSITDAYKWLFQTMGPKGLAICGIAIIITIGAGILANLPALFLGQIVNSLTASSAQGSSVWDIFGLIIGSLVIVEVLTLIRKYLIESVAVRAQKDAFMEQAEHLFSVPVTALMSHRTGTVAVHLDRCIEGLIKLLKLTFMEMAPSAAFAIAAIYFAFREHWLSGSAMLGMILIASGFTYWQISSQKGIRISLEKSKGKIGGLITELLGALPFIRAAGIAKHETGRLNKVAENLKETEMTHHRYMMSFDAAKKLTENFGLVVIIGCGLYLVGTDELLPGDILTLVLLYKNAANPLEKMHKILDEGHEAIIRIGMLGSIRQLPKDIGLHGKIVPNTGNSSPLAKFSGYKFHFGEPDTHNANPHLDLGELSIQQGEIIGVAGESGSGKSTLIQALMGLYSGHSGSLRILDTEINDVSKDWLAKQISYAPQRPFIVSGTIRDNVLLGLGPDECRATSDADIIQALERAQFDMATNSKESVLNKSTAEGGRNLSGGEAQRIGLARVFLSKARILILDEATSALDTITERRVQTQLVEHSKGKTVIMIAHRLSTLSWAKRILVVRHGSLVEDGGYDELSQSGGAFSNLMSHDGTMIADIAAE